MPRYLEIAAGFKRSLNWDAVRDVPDPEKGVEKYDMRDLPMKGVADNTYDGVYSEHFIEHLTRSEGVDFLMEMKRVLKPGGTIRTIWPPREFVDKLLSDEPLTVDEEYFCAAYHKFYVVRHNFAPPGYENEPIRIQCAQGLLWQNGEHLYVWSKEELMQCFKDLGFIMTRSHNYQQSRVVDFQNMDTDSKIRMLHSAVVEAQKPW
jgi:ubiquinone/menaquinone biosynthesis C-methylase UbiE|tara:strand:+ start:488 stop:1102 length:615 start_codon:yes stop_codon:yes gene_type:complete